jgi:thymidylate kinase
MKTVSMSLEEFEELQKSAKYIHDLKGFIEENRFIELHHEVNKFMPGYYYGIDLVYDSSVKMIIARERSEEMLIEELIEENKDLRSKYKELLKRNTKRWYQL